jgi:hypothetical protein
MSFSAACEAVPFVQKTERALAQPKQSRMTLPKSLATQDRAMQPHHYGADVIVRTNVWVCVGANAPDAVTVTLSVLDCRCGELLNEVPQPVRAITQAKKDNHSCALRELFPEKPQKNNGIGEASARSNPGEVRNSLLLEAPMVMFVLSGALPDSVEGANVHPHPLGSPEQANDSEALNPFSGATETVKDPGALCVMVSVPLERVSP